MKIERILLTTDFSECAAQAYATAAGLARRMDARLELAHCVDLPYHLAPLPFLGLDPGFERSCARIREKLAGESGGPAFKGLEVGTRLLAGHGPEAVARWADENRIDLIVQSSHGRTGLGRFLLGSFAERLLRTSRVPVLTIRPRLGEPERAFEPRKILFPYDFSPCAHHALEPVRMLAHTFEAKVLVLHVWREIPDLLPPGGLGGEGVEADFTASCEQLPDRFLGKLREFAAVNLEGIENDVKVLCGEPATLIRACADAFEVDLVGMATHGWTGLKRLVLGSVAEKVIRAMNGPILTIRPPDEVLRAEAEWKELGVVTSP